MTKSELMVRLAEVFAQKNGTHLLAKDVEYSVKILVDTMTRSLARGQRIEIRGFGSFDLNHRPARQGRNPKTGDKVSVPEKCANESIGQWLPKPSDCCERVPPSAALFICVLKTITLFNIMCKSIIMPIP